MEWLLNVIEALNNGINVFVQGATPDPNPVATGFNPLGSIDLAHWEDLIGLVIRLLMHMAFVTVLVRFIYYPIARRKDFLFTYILMGVSIFLMCLILSKVNIDTGLGLGLFAVFAIIRYRTDAIPIKEMTYLFVVIAMSVMNALINKKISMVELVFANAVIIGIVYGLEKVWLLRHESQKLVVYENIDFIQKGRRQELIDDLEKRTAIKINRVDIGKIDFLRDVVTIRIFFYEDEQNSHMDDSFSGRGGSGD